MIQEDVIEASNTEWASSIILVTKKDGLLRFCVNYRNLNGITVRDS